MLDQCLLVARREFFKREDVRWRHWSFIIQNRQIIEWGINRPTCPQSIVKMGYKQLRHVVHSEITALAKARGRMDRRRPWTLVNIRLDALANPRMASPCSLCEAFVRAHGCQTVYYTDDLGRFVKIV
jgi:hypothetical protein